MNIENAWNKLLKYYPNRSIKVNEDEPEADHSTSSDESREAFLEIVRKKMAKIDYPELQKPWMDRQDIEDMNSLVEFLLQEYESNRETIINEYSSDLDQSEKNLAEALEFLRGKFDEYKRGI